MSKSEQLVQYGLHLVLFQSSVEPLDDVRDFPRTMVISGGFAVGEKVRDEVTHH